MAEGVEARSRFTVEGLALKCLAGSKTLSLNRGADNRRGMARIIKRFRYRASAIKRPCQTTAIAHSLGERLSVIGVSNDPEQVSSALSIT